MNKNLALIISGIVCMYLISCVDNTQTSNSVSNQIDMNSTIIENNSSIFDSSTIQSSSIENSPTIKDTSSIFDDTHMDEQTKDIRKFLANPIDSINDFTGLLNGYNVVTIMIETGTSCMVNETLTPNLYSMISNGINCENNYFKNKTNVSEYIGIVGNYPTSGLGNKKLELVLPFSLPNMLEEYNTMYFHDVGSTRDIYSRKKLMPVLGFDKSYFHEDLLPDVEEWHWGGNYPLDSITMDSVLSYMLQDTTQPFYAFYTSLSMHGPYVNPTNKKLLKSMYYEKLSEAANNNKWENPLKDTVNEGCIENYMLACMDFDVALGKMINAFKEKNIYENTLFVLYGDHDLYYAGADKQQLSFSLKETTDINNYKLYDTVLLFSNPKLNLTYKEKKKEDSFNKFSTPHLVVPTILDLLGIKYNANIYMMDSIFSNNYSDNEIFYSYELKCYMNEEYLSINGNDIENNNKGELSEEEMFLYKIRQYMEKQSYIDMIYKSNTFSKYNFNDFNY